VKILKTLKKFQPIILQKKFKCFLKFSLTLFVLLKIGADYNIVRHYTKRNGSRALIPSKWKRFGPPLSTSHLIKAFRN